MSNHEIETTMINAKEALRRYSYMTCAESIGAKQTTKLFPAIVRVTSKEELDRKARLEIKRGRGNWIGTVSATI